MGVESLPLLTAIWTAIGTLIKVLWDSIAKAASRAAFYFATIVPMIIRWFVKYRAFALALVVAVAGIIRTFLQQVYSVVNQSIQVQNSLAFLESHFTWMYYLCIHGPLALDVIYRKILNEIIPLWLSLLLLHWSSRKINFVVWLMGKKFRP